ncbi:FtsX-like permease family protein [Corynebacterium hadale]|uniref:ABC transporter permease n=1 Tax=Corynebacterium hadale TaxID=2026255 RepID=UPI001EF380E5|nr:FtsX-like permease family protein [Corynebacterium hadale]MCG7255242.1 FtsX-like permease family protein [Corynebacterium hadale]MCG7257494.1 FtsX-like permease family protein [Corynebacterium hadale]MCG7266227.1 FtsX-like permease family protein [Corynebacterium hadale]
MASPMATVSLRNVAAHKLRLALTVLSVVLGTAFLSGALMFTSMLSSTFDSAVGTVLDGTDAVVRPGEGQGSISREEADEIAAHPDVARTNIFAEKSIVAAHEDETAIQMRMGASRLGLYYGLDDAVGAPTELTEGRAPDAIGEVVLNANGAENYGIELGERLIAVDRDGRNELTVTGFYDNELAQKSSLLFRVSPETYTEFYTQGDTVPALTVAAADRVGDDAIVEKLHAAHPELEIATGQSVADDTSAKIREALSFVSYFLIAFALVGMLVGTFLIANTFSMIVAQRTKEFALLRALGATKDQITRSVALESALVGVIGSALGVAGGVGLVAAIKVAMRANGMELPDAGVGLTWQAVATPLVVGTIVTVLSALAPARRAGQVRPVEAMRASESATPQPLKWRTIAGVVLLVVGVAAAAAGMAWDDGSTGRRAALVGAAALAAITGLFLAGPALSLPVVPPFGRAIGLPFGATGKLASTNTSRNPRRTATTAFALMLGIALVTVIGMLGATMKHSVDDVAKSEVSADYVLYGPELGSFPVPSDLPDRLAQTPGVGTVTSYSQAPVTVDGEYGHQLGPAGATDVIDGNTADLLQLNMVEGSADLSGNTLIAPTEIAAQRGWHVGDPLELAAPGVSTDTVEVTVGGLFEDSNILQTFVVSGEAAAQVATWKAETILMVGVSGDGTVDQTQLRTNLEDAVRHDIVVQVRSAEDVAGEAATLIDQMLFILYALLSLAVIIAVLGIINTLTLSVIERRQELGMLRAVGTQRRQIRTMITLESVQMSVFGAALGVLLGLGLGWAFLTVLESQGLSTIIIPGRLIATVLGGSVIVGALAALWPARRAASTPPLDAIAD